MGLLPRRSRPARAVSGLMATILAVATSAARADAPATPSGGGRVPWTSSRLRGTPDPPLPYAAEPAFPRLAFDRPVLLDQAPGSRRLVVGEVGGKVLTFADDPAADRADVALDLAVGRPRDRGPLRAGVPSPVRGQPPGLPLLRRCRTTAPTARASPGSRSDGTDPPRIDPESEEVLLTWPSGGHNGGCLAFGPDGYLYISTGDAAGPTPPDPLDTGQDVGDLLSSILRIDVDRRDPGRAYRVPPDNPFVHQPGRPAGGLGLRAPQPLADELRPRDRRPVGRRRRLGAVGADLSASSAAATTAGASWRAGSRSDPEARRGPTPILPPIVDHPHSEAASITGGYVYRGDRLPDLVGAYVYGDYQSGKVWGLRHDGRVCHLARRAGRHGPPPGLLRRGRRGGALPGRARAARTRSIASSPNRAARDHRDFPRTLSRTGLFASTRDHAPAPGVVPYAINAEAWADGARAERLLAIPGDGPDRGRPEGALEAPRRLGAGPDRLARS